MRALWCTTIGFDLAGNDFQSVREIHPKHPVHPVGPAPAAPPQVQQVFASFGAETLSPQTLLPLAGFVLEGHTHSIGHLAKDKGGGFRDEIVIVEYILVWYNSNTS